VLCKTRLVSLCLTRTRRWLHLTIIDCVNLSHLTIIDCVNLSLAFPLSRLYHTAIVYDDRLHSLIVHGA